MSTIRFTSLVSTIADPFCAALAHHLSTTLPYPIEFFSGSRFADRETAVDTQAVDLVWLCGLLYLHKSEAGQMLTPAVAPCMNAEQPAGQPCYYADIVVRAQSGYQTFADLRGSTWAYNEEASFSGYQMMQAHLAQQHETGSFFGKLVKSGAHLNSIELVRHGAADCAAIDSTVLQMLRPRNPVVIAELRTIARLGPYPIPLWAFTTRCDPALQRPMTDILTQLHHDATGRKLLHEWQIERFVAVTKPDYEPVYDTAALA